MIDRIVEHLLEDQVHGTRCHRPVAGTDRQQQRRRLSAIGEALRATSLFRRVLAARLAALDASGQQAVRRYSQQGRL